jgi:hypothetical protein
MEPVQIKLYGLFRHTRKSYLKQQALSALLALSLLPVWLLAPRLDTLGRQAGTATNRHADFLPKYEIEAARSPTGGLSPEVVRLIGLLNLIPWVVLGLLAAIAVETAVVWRLFANKEAARQAAVSTEPVEPGPQPSA